MAHRLHFFHNIAFTVYETCTLRLYLYHINMFFFLLLFYSLGQKYSSGLYHFGKGGPRVFMNIYAGVNSH